MKANLLLGLRRDQRGFTAVELIVTLAISSLVMTSVFPLFSLSSSVYRTWQGNAESRAVGQSAAVILGRDLRDDAVVRAKMKTDVLVLQAAPNSPPGVVQAGNQKGLCIRYEIATSSVKSSVPFSTLVRDVLDERGNVTSTSVVAHGVNQFTPSFVDPATKATIEINLQLATIPPTQYSGQVSVPLWFSTRVPPAGWRPVC